MLDALNYIKAARALSVPAGLEVSRSGTGAHTWIFFTGPVPAETARRLGTGLLREAMALRGQMSLASYDRLFPSQDTLPAGGVGNLIAAPLYGKARRDGATVFLDPATMEPHEDQWAYLSTLGRMTPREVASAANRAGRVVVGTAVERIEAAGSTRTQPQLQPVVHARLGAGIRLEQSELTSAFLATLKHAASMKNPLFYERQRLRLSTWDLPQFLRSFEETLDGGLVLPRGMADRVASLVEQAGSRLDITDERDQGKPRTGLRFTGTLMVWSLLAGPVIGLISAGYIRLIGWVSYHRAKGPTALYAPVIAFGILGVVGIWYPQLFGNGLDMARDAFLGIGGLSVLLALFALKPLVTEMCLGSGASGGLFTPTPATGAVLGGALGMVWNPGLARLTVRRFRHGQRRRHDRRGDAGTAIRPGAGARTDPQRLRADGSHDGGHSHRHRRGLPR